jgi:hypothetical protein
MDENERELALQLRRAAMEVADGAGTDATASFLQSHA